MRESGVTLREMDRRDEAIAQRGKFLGSRPNSVFERRETASELRLLAQTLLQAGLDGDTEDVDAQVRKFWKQRPPAQRFGDASWCIDH